ILKDKNENLQLKEGEEAAVGFEFINISKLDFPDSLTVEWTLNHIGQRRTEKLSRKIPAVKAGQSYAFTVPFQSMGWAGNISLNVFANPHEYMEQTFRNNVMDLPDYFQVQGDELNPILDVSFDGVYIMDGDIVSPTVLISALVKDENRLSLKKDTTGMEVCLKRECEGCSFERVSFCGMKMKWFEATEE